LPIALVSILQGLSRAQLDVAAVREKLIQSARATASSDENLLASAEQVLRAVSSLPDVRDISGDCDRILADTLTGIRYFSNLSRIDADGRVVCSAMVLAKGINASDIEVFQRAKTSRDGMVVSSEMKSRVTGQNVIGALLPLWTPDGDFHGTIGIALDVHWIDYMLRASTLPPGAAVTVYDRSGQIIATNNPGVSRAVLASAKANGYADGISSDIADAEGRSWHYGTASLIGNTIFLAYGMRSAELFGSTYLHVALDFLVPVLTIMLAWIAIWWFTSREVTQWILYLRRIAAAYRSGHYVIRPDVAGAPAEFRILGDAMGEMAAGIEVDVPSRVVTGSIAVAIALFTVEVLTNIFKHAFPGQRHGVIRVTMAETGDGKLRLGIADDGIGFEEEQATKSVGSRLIKTFGLQLGGTAQVRSVTGEGTVVELIFPDPALSPPAAASV